MVTQMDVSSSGITVSKSECDERAVTLFIYPIFIGYINEAKLCSLCELKEQVKQVTLCTVFLVLVLIEYIKKKKKTGVFLSCVAQYSVLIKNTKQA